MRNPVYRFTPEQDQAKALRCRAIVGNTNLFVALVVLSDLAGFVLLAWGVWAAVSHFS